MWIQVIFKHVSLAQTSLFKCRPVLPTLSSQPLQIQSEQNQLIIFFLHFHLILQFSISLEGTTAHLLIIVSGLISYTTYKLGKLVMPATVSWVLAEDTRFLGQRQRTFLWLSKQHEFYDHVGFPAPQSHRDDLE